jgi:hypothetical protein
MKSIQLQNRGPCGALLSCHVLLLLLLYSDSAMLALAGPRRRRASEPDHVLFLTLRRRLVEEGRP